MFDFQKQSPGKKIKRRHATSHKPRKKLASSSFFTLEKKNEEKNAERKKGDWRQQQRARLFLIFFCGRLLLLSPPTPSWKSEREPLVFLNNARAPREGGVLCVLASQ